VEHKGVQEVAARQERVQQQMQYQPPKVESA
jgi:hypothetical protein